MPAKSKQKIPWRFSQSACSTSKPKFSRPTAKHKTHNSQCFQGAWLSKFDLAYLRQGQPNSEVPCLHRISDVFQCSGAPVLAHEKQICTGFNELSAFSTDKKWKKQWWLGVGVRTKIRTCAAKATQSSYFMQKPQEKVETLLNWITPTGESKVCEPEATLLLLTGYIDTVCDRTISGLYKFTNTTH